MGSVASYTNQTASVSDYTNRQFAPLMIRNLRLSPDTMKSILLELTSVSGMSKAAKRTDVTLTGEEWKVLNTMIRKGTNGNETTRHKILNKV